jgi:hypothetical protein
MIEEIKLQVGDKMKVTRSISTVDGTLYQDTIVKVTGIGYPDKDVEVKDPLGKLWYLNYDDVKLYEKRDK